MTFTSLASFYNRIMTHFPHDPLQLTHFLHHMVFLDLFYNKIHQKTLCTSTNAKTSPECPIWWLWQLEMEEVMILIKIWLISSHLLITWSLSSWKSRATSSSGVYKLGLFGWARGSLSCKTEVKSHKICQYNFTVIVSHLMNH